jgi:hypothetical protein
VPSPPQLDQEHALLIDALVLLLCDADGSDVRSLLPVDGLKTPSLSSSAPASTAVAPVAAPQAASDAILNIGNSDKMNALGDCFRES